MKKEQEQKPLGIVKKLGSPSLFGNIIGIKPYLQFSDELDASIQKARTLFTEGKYQESKNKALEVEQIIKADKNKNELEYQPTSVLIN